MLLTGTGLLALLITGMAMLLRKGAKRGTRGWHRVAGAILLLPLTATALTGMLYIVGQQWLGFPEEVSSLLMSIHEGAWLGEQLRPLYVLFVGVGLLMLGGLGLRLLPVRRKTR